MAQSFTNLLTHVVFSTKDRLPLIRSDLKPQLLAYLGGIVRQLDSKALLFNGTADHVHGLVKMAPVLSTAEFMRILKANSSGWVHQTRVSRFAWQSGYGAFSVSESDVPRVLRYIENQEVHHRRVSFQEELLELLKRHGVKYDERYIWK